MRKYFIIGLAAFILEVASTMYITTVASNNVAMIFWAFIGPFLALPFVGYMVESKVWSERIVLAFCSGLGYAVGAMLVYFYNIL